MARFIRFLGTGIVSVPIYYSVLYFLTETGIWYITSSVVAFMLYYSVNFGMHKYWAFKSTGALWRELPLHLTLALINVGVNSLGLYVLVEYASIWYLYAQFLMTIVITVENWMFSRWIFKH